MKEQALTLTAGHELPRRQRREAGGVSLVLLSRGEGLPLARALQIVRPMVSRLGAQLIVVRTGPAADSGLHDDRVQTVVLAPGTADRAMRRAAMAVARGDIVVLRDVEAVGDGSWLDRFLQGDGASLTADRVAVRMVAREPDARGSAVPSDARLRESAGLRLTGGPPRA